MAGVEFLAFGAYVRKVFRRDESDDGDTGSPGASGLRCRIWSRATPSGAGYKKGKTFILDLTKHADDPPNFTTANASKIHCDAPGYTGIGAGTPTTDSFEDGDDFVGRVYLNQTFWAGLDPTNEQPTFPPVAQAQLPPLQPGQKGRRTRAAPMDFEFRSWLFANNDGDQKRRKRRYLGYYADVIDKVAGTTDTWNVRVFHWASDAFEDYQLDFTDTSTYAPQTAITGSATSSGALYLDSVAAAGLHMRLPKIPPGQAFAGVPGPPSPVSLSFSSRSLVPTTSYVQQLIQRLSSI